MDDVTIKLAGSSNPYPWRPTMASGDGVSSSLNKTEPVNSAMARSKLTWLYSNGGINQTADIFERPNLTRLETYPFEYSQKEGRTTCDIQDTNFPDSQASSNVSDAVISSMMRKIWHDLHPTSERWQKMTFHPTLDTLTETFIPDETKTEVEELMIVEGIEVFKIGGIWRPFYKADRPPKPLKKKGLKSAFRYIAKKFRRAFNCICNGNNNNSQSCFLNLCFNDNIYFLEKE